MDLGSVAGVCKHAFIGGQIPFLDVGIGRTGVHISIKYCGTYDVTLMSSAKWGSLLTLLTGSNNQFGNYESELCYSVFVVKNN